MVLHVGTNDLTGSSVKAIVSSYSRLLDLVRSRNKAATVGVSSIRPKLSEPEEVNLQIVQLNRELKKECANKGRCILYTIIQTICSEKPTD